MDRWIVELDRRPARQLRWGMIAALFVSLFVPSGTGWAGQLAPLDVQNSVGEDRPTIGRFSERTLVLAVEADRDHARLIAYTVKERPFASPLETEGARPYADRVDVQFEIVLLGPDGRSFTQRIDAGPLCLAHPAGTAPHVEGDTVRLHRDSFLVEVPEVAGFDRVEVAYYDGAGARKSIGVEKLDRARFDVAGGRLGYADLAIADPSDASKPVHPASATVRWPEYYGDPDIYKIYGVAGEGTQRINVVIVPDGYTYAEKSVMETHAKDLTTYLRAKTPYAEHDPFMNYTLVYAYSLASGTDQCDCGIVLDTAMGTRFPNAGDVCGGSGNRCLYYYYGSGECDTDGGANISAAELRAPVRDKTLIMVNTARYGGCGGYRAVYSAGNASAREVAVHELGHSLAGLADEYVSYSSCGTSAGEVNTSLNSTTGAWPEWIGDLGAPRQGADYYSLCIYRPKDNCEMRSLNQPFCQVCNQRWSLVTYGHSRVNPTAPIASKIPPTSPVSAYVGVPADFSVTTRLSGGSATSTIEWYLQGPGYPDPTLIGTGSPSLTRTFTSEGAYNLSCQVTADTNFVKPSKYGANRDTASWVVNVSPTPVYTCGGRPATIVGSGGDDVIYGTAGNDVIVGFGGNDKIYGLAGDDVICGNAGNDTLVGGPGNDALAGGTGYDTINGGGGTDKCSGEVMKTCEVTALEQGQDEADESAPQ